MSSSHKYKYKIATEGTVTAEAWDAMTLGERLDTFKKVRKLSSDVQVAAALGVHKMTVSRWRKGKRAICSESMLRMEDACVHNQDMPMKEFVAMNTIAVDPALDVFDRAFIGNNYVALNVSCYVLALKMAVAAESVLPFTVVPTLYTCCGVTPASVLLTITVPGTEFKADITVTYVTAPTREYVARVNLVVGDKIRSRFGYTMSDRAMSVILDKIKKYVISHVKRSGKSE